MSPQLWQLFVEEPKPRQNCWGTPHLDDDSYRPCIDAIAARRSALFDCPLPLPVFCVTDAVETYCPLRGLQYSSYIEIDLTRDGLECAEQDQQYMPYCGRTGSRSHMPCLWVRSERFRKIMDEAEY